MNKIRLSLNLIIVLSTSLLVGVLALDRLNGTENNGLVNVFLQTMHFSFLIGSILNLIYFFKARKFIIVSVIAIPLILFIIAYIGVAIEFSFSNLSLIIFDFYLIFLFFFLTIKELYNYNKNSQ